MLKLKLILILRYKNRESAIILLAGHGARSANT